VAKTSKQYNVVETRDRDGRTSNCVGTLEHLVSAYSYTLEVGASWEHEKGNKKINRNPKNIASLVKNLDNAKTNAAANGYSGVNFSYTEVLA